MNVQQTRLQRDYKKCSDSWHSGAALLPFAKMGMDLNEIVDAWIAAENAEHGSAEYESNWWAVDQVMDWSLDHEGEQLWRFITATYKRELSDKAVAVLAAGPLEDLLARQGPEFIDRVEELARRDPQFNYLLGGVWRNTMTDEVWKRVQAARHLVW